MHIHPPRQPSRPRRTFPAHPGIEAAVIELFDAALAALRELLSRPLSLPSLGYRPSADELRLEPGRPDRPPGEPADEPAAAIGWPLANAGLFSSVEDLARCAAAMLSAAQGRPGPLPLAPSDLRAVWEPVDDAPCPYGLFWDRGSPQAMRHRPAWCSDGAVGHGGFTGQSLWLDPQADRFAILCSNRLHIPGAIGPAWLGHAQRSARWRGVVLDGIDW